MPIYYQDFVNGNDANTGLSWVQAKKTLPIISGGGGGANCTRWNIHGSNPISIVGGDTVYISGGSTSVTIPISGGWEPPSGSSVGSRITYRVGQDSGHNGIVYFQWDGTGGSAQFYNGPQYVIISGILGSDTSTRQFRLIDWPRNRTTTMEPTKQSTAFANVGTGTIIEGVDTSDGVGMFYGNNNSGDIKGCTIRYCTIYCDDTNYGNSTMTLVGNSTSTAYKDNEVYGNTITGIWSGIGNGLGYDLVKVGNNGWSIHHNLMQWVADANYGVNSEGQQQHADGWQNGGGDWMEFYDNRMLNYPNYGLYFEAITLDGITLPQIHHVRVYNNQFCKSSAALTQSNGLGMAIVMGPNGVNYAGHTFYGDDILIANNTVVDGGGQLAQITLNQNAGVTGVWTNCKIQNNVCVNCNGTIDQQGTGTGVWDGTNAVDHNVEVSAGAAATAFTSYTTLGGLSNNMVPTAAATTVVSQAVNLSSLFTDDLSGATRPGTWDIGAYQFGAGGSPLSGRSLISGYTRLFLFKISKGLNSFIFLI
jgi:hypothetical protein